jgi:DNA-binding GntR family transcriptional regulator
MSPLREALAHLAGQGLVIQESQRGFAVAPISDKNLADVARTRIRLETMAFQLAIENGDAAWEAGMLSAHHRLVRHQDAVKNLIDEEWEQLHRAFHLSLINACGSPLLLSFCEITNGYFDRYRRIAMRTARRQPTLTASHAKLIEAAIQRKTSAAVELLSQHIRRAENQISQLAGSRMFANMIQDLNASHKARSSNGIAKPKSRRKVRETD